MSYLTNLVCSECGHRYDPAVLQTFCPACQAPLLTQYDFPAIRLQLDRDEIRSRPNGMWRWAELLPVYDKSVMIYLGEGDTPLLHAERLGAAHGIVTLFIKDESQNPTGSFKARGLAVAVSKAKELGVKKVIIPTAGNAGGAMTAYAARGGLQACVIMPKNTPEANLVECQMMGAEVILVDGLISDAARLAAKKSAEEGWFDVSTFKEPYRTEGKKIMGYELAEAFNWRLPDVIIYPTGGGTGLVGMWKAFAELEALGWIEDTKRPRLVSVQSEGCAPVVKAIQEGTDHCEFWENAQTIAAGLRVPKSFADRIILRDIRASQGTAVAVSDEQILVAQREMAQTEGIFAAPEGAATLAAWKKLIIDGWIEPDEQVVLFNTGSGLKYIH
jgi:threonine synthase